MLHDILRQLREGDEVVVWNFIACRATRTCRTSCMQIEAAGAGFRLLTESNDAVRSAGRIMMMPMVGSFAKFRRAMTRERTSAGLRLARAEGRRGG